MIKTMTANQKMAELFQCDKSTISRHIRNVSESGEPKQDPCSAKFATRQFLQPRRKRLLKFGSRLLLPGGKRIGPDKGGYRKKKYACPLAPSGCATRNLYATSFRKPLSDNHLHLNFTHKSTY